MTIVDHIQQQEPSRQALMKALHDIILVNDTTVTATVGTMMRQEMILYNCITFKYGLASTKEHLSLHCLPIYVDPALHAKYLALLPEAKVQKGCINFKSEAELPLDIATQLISDCAGIDLIAIREKQLAERKKKK